MLLEEDYKNVVEIASTKMRKMDVFQSVLHDIYIQLKNKVALTPQDDERFDIPGTFRTLAWGHKSIEPLKSIMQKNDNKTLNHLVTELNDKICDLQIPEFN